ncbi:hypothetical protein R3W88_023330 [Solanum pinnatisectum]|uniref:Reverse transcriptase zinc-binding domain-containing protein n=1 Tax=Solanum pinnatisectum TaxID=50273 RepID=A0AAV9LX71_9SOLN|nr:hypothetical protein R3W88_023330 [Solanum pinnatisectum]
MYKFVRMEKFSIQKVYTRLRGEYEKVRCRKLVCNNVGAPGWIFILFVELHGRLLTKTRLAQWGYLEDVMCPLCRTEREDMEHLFLQMLFCCYDLE